MATVSCQRDHVPLDRQRNVAQTRQRGLWMPEEIRRQPGHLRGRRRSPRNGVGVLVVRSFAGDGDILRVRVHRDRAHETLVVAGDGARAGDNVRRRAVPIAVDHAGRDPSVDCGAETLRFEVALFAELLVGVEVPGGADGDDAGVPCMRQQTGPHAGIARPGDVEGGVVEDIDVSICGDVRAREREAWNHMGQSMVSLAWEGQLTVGYHEDRLAAPLLPIDVIQGRHPGCEHVARSSGAGVAEELDADDCGLLRDAQGNAIDGRCHGGAVAVPRSIVVNRGNDLAVAANDVRYQDRLDLLACELLWKRMSVGGTRAPGSMDRTYRMAEPEASVEDVDEGTVTS